MSTGNTIPAKIAPDHPALPGHFPGQPIAPGALILDLVIAAAEHAFPEHWISGVRRMKFLGRLSPGSEIAIAFNEPTAAGVRFRIIAREAIAAEGQLIFAAAAAPIEASSGLAD